MGWTSRFGLLSLAAREEADEPVEHRRQLVAGQIVQDPHAGARGHAPTTADENVDAVHDLAVDLHLAALQADVGRVVIAARRRAPRPAHRDRPASPETRLE